MSNLSLSEYEYIKILIITCITILKYKFTMKSVIIRVNCSIKIIAFKHAYMTLIRVDSKHGVILFQYLIIKIWR